MSGAGRLLVPADAAAVTGISKKTLANYRSRGGGPPYFKIGGSFIRYDEDDLIAWMRSRRLTSTSQQVEA